MSMNYPLARSNFGDKDNAGVSAKGRNDLDGGDY